MTISLVCVYAYQAIACSRYVATGDALFDRYARAVIQRQAWRLFSGGGGNPATLPDRQLAGWEPEFGDDPRYWQLRAWCAFNRDVVFTSKNFDAWMGSPGRHSAAATYLVEACERGVADAVILHYLYSKYSLEWQRETEKLWTEYSTLTSDTRLAENTDLIAEIEREEQDYLAEVIAADPGNAWPYYYRAKYWSFMGEVELALDDFRAGNNAPDTSPLKLFPVSFVLDRKEAGQGIGNRYLSGAVLQADQTDMLDNWIRWKDCGKQFMCVAALGGDASYLAEYHKFACRVGMAEWGSAFYPFVAVHLVMILSEYTLDELAEDLELDERKTLLAGHRKSLELLREINEWQVTDREQNLGFGLLSRKQLGKHYIGPPDGWFAYLNQPRHLLHQLSGWAQYMCLHIPWYSVLMIDSQVDKEIRFRKHGLWSGLRDLELMDYSCLEYPEQWQRGN